MNEVSQIFALVYSSRASGDLGNADLERILVDASARNRMNDVTGALLFDGVHFFQYLEGTRRGVDTIYQNIQRASSHAAIHVLASGEVRERHFWNWSMACKHADASLIQRLEASRWSERAHPHLLDDSEGNEGLTLLSAFWNADPPDLR